jgi:hypothetical protein
MTPWRRLTPTIPAARISRARGGEVAYCADRGVAGAFGKADLAQGRVALRDAGAETKVAAVAAPSGNQLARPFAHAAGWGAREPAKTCHRRSARGPNLEEALAGCLGGLLLFDQHRRRIHNRRPPTFEAAPVRETPLSTDLGIKGCFRRSPTSSKSRSSVLGRERPSLISG